MLWLLILIPAVLAALYWLGVVSIKLALVSAGWDWGFGRWWQGRYAYFSGRLLRRFSVKGSAMELHVQSEKGVFSLEVRDGGGAALYAWYGIRCLDTRVDIRGYGRCVVQFRGENYRGEFAIWVEP